MQQPSAMSTATAVKLLSYDTARFVLTIVARDTGVWERTWAGAAGEKFLCSARRVWQACVFAPSSRSAR